MSKLIVAGFTNAGYRIHSRAFEPLLDDMTGKTVVVTGASGGLGLAASQAMSDLGARLILVGRDEAKLRRASQKMSSEVRTKRFDLSLLKEVKALAMELLEEEPRVDVLVNNVGVLLPERQVTSEGLEMSFATNLGGHFVLTNLLIPRLIESGESRIINVSSGGMYSTRCRPDDLQFQDSEYSGTAAYARTKRGQVILTEMWAERLRGTEVMVDSMHPGWAKTPGIEQSLPAFNKLMKPFLRTPEQGADTIVWLAAAKTPSGQSGTFWFDRRPALTHLSEKTVESSEDRKDLWKALVELTETDLPDLPTGTKPPKLSSPGSV